MTEVQKLQKQIDFLRQVIVEIACQEVNDRKIARLMNKMDNLLWDESLPNKE